MDLELVKNLLLRSLLPLPHETNDVDWKVGLSQDTERLAHHLSAFSNQAEGGFIVYGVHNDGSLLGINSIDYEEIIKKLGNIARMNLDPPIVIDHCIQELNGKNLLFFYVEESREKPVHLRGHSIFESYMRSAGQTRKMTREEVSRCIAQSSNLKFEEGIAARDLDSDGVLKRIDYASYFDLAEKNLPESKEAILESLESEGLLKKKGDKIDITNLGAILFAKNISDFGSLGRKAVRGIVYEGKNRLNTVKEILFQKGYASGFESLIKEIVDLLPTNEVIEQALRKQVKMYPPLAIRELVANALIHQNFQITGTGPMIEVFSDRMEITNPGIPLIDTRRFMDYPPSSRNETLAALMRRLKICEERGSGIDKVIFQVEIFQLPAPNFIVTEDHLKVVLYAHRRLANMDKNDKTRVCYQHACLKYVSGEKMTNLSLRKRFNIADKNYPMASRIISDALKTKFIKSADPDSKSKKFSHYLPYWA